MLKSRELRETTDESVTDSISEHVEVRPVSFIDVEQRELDPKSFSVECLLFGYDQGFKFSV